MKALINLAWLESQAHIIDWSHTASPTVKRSITFFYKGDYEAPQLLRKSSDPGAVPPRPAEVQVKLKHQHSSAFQGERSKTFFLPILGDCLKLESPSMTVETAAGRFERFYKLSIHKIWRFQVRQCFAGSRSDLLLCTLPSCFKSRDLGASTDRTSLAEDS